MSACIPTPNDHYSNGSFGYSQQLGLLDTVGAIHDSKCLDTVKQTDKMYR